MEYNTFKDRLFKEASKKGFEEFELYYSSGESLKVGVYEGDIDTYDSSISCGAGFRVKIAGKMGYAYTEATDERAIDTLLMGAAQNAEVVDTVNEEFIYTEKVSYAKVDTYNEKLEELTPYDIKDFALKMEKATFKEDKRVTRIKSCITGFSNSSMCVANSSGIDLTYKVNGFYAYVIPIVKQNEEIRTGMAYRIGRDFYGVNAEDVSREAVSKAVSFLGAGPVKSGKYRVLFKNEAMIDLLETFSPVFSAERVQKGISLLKGKTGSEVASSAVSIVDDPLLINGMSSRPFDCEGVASYRKCLIDKGVLNGFLHNNKTAKKDGIKSTGNADRSYSSSVVISPTNMFIEKSNITTSELMDSLDNGLFITELEGLHAGANEISGDFSLSAKGFTVSSGNLDRPVAQITIAGNIFNLLKSVEKVGSDIKFGLPGSGCFGSPSVLVTSLTAAGE